MSPTDELKIIHGLPERHRGQVAEIYYEAFCQKLEPILASQAHGTVILERSFDPEFAIVALRGAQFAGLAGVQHGGGHFLSPQMSTFVREFGWWRGLFRLALFVALDSHYDADELLIDGIVVHPAMRGQGVGTRLLQAACDRAREKGLRSVRLEVVDTNPRARRLYERLGFVPIKTQKYRFLRNALGFSAVTAMIKEVL